MTNLTLSINEKVLKKARIQALEQGTSLNALVREFFKITPVVHRNSST
jgi:predicted HicB family RNase H-like nuclease